MLVCKVVVFAMSFLGMTVKYEGDPHCISGVEVLLTDWSLQWISKNDLADTSRRLLAAVPEEGEAFQRFSLACGNRSVDYNAYMQKSTLIYAFVHMKYFRPTFNWDHMTPSMWSDALLNAVRASCNSRLH